MITEDDIQRVRDRQLDEYLDSQDGDLIYKYRSQYAYKDDDDYGDYLYEQSRYEEDYDE